MDPEIILKRFAMVAGILSGWFLPGLILVNWFRPGAVWQMDLARLALLMAVLPGPGFLLFRTVAHAQKQPDHDKDGSEAVYYSAVALHLVALPQWLFDWPAWVAVGFWLAIVCLAALVRRGCR